jgi:hypothetical protein
MHPAAGGTLVAVRRRSNTHPSGCIFDWKAARVMGGLEALDKAWGNSGAPLVERATDILSRSRHTFAIPSASSFKTLLETTSVRDIETRKSCK